MKLLYPLSTAVNVLPFQLLPCCTLYTSSDISHLTSALTTTQVAAYKETQITAERNTINTRCTTYVSQSSQALCTKTGHKFYHKLYLYGPDDPWFSQQRQDMFLSSKTSRTALAPNQPLLKGYHRLLSLGYSRGSTKMAAQLHPMPNYTATVTGLHSVDNLTFHHYQTEDSLTMQDITYATYFLTNPHTAVPYACSLFLFPSEARHCWVPQTLPAVSWSLWRWWPSCGLVTIISKQLKAKSKWGHSLTCASPMLITKQC
jgi:hypothetical protein